MYDSKVPLDITVVFYTCNYLQRQNPHFWNATQEQLKIAVGDLPIVSVSHKPIKLGHNIVLGNIGRSHLNIYRQILAGCKASKTKYVAMAEDDILYSYSHFHTTVPRPGYFAYDMEKLSLFTWTKPPMYSFRTNRRVINQLIAHRDLLIEALEERFAKVEERMANGETEDNLIKVWGDIGRYERKLGVTPRHVEEFYSHDPSIVFTHPKAFGFEMNHGKKKKLGDIKMFDIPIWGKAEDLLKKAWGDQPYE